MASTRQYVGRVLGPPRVSVCTAVVGLLGLLLWGCATQRVTDPERTATEQFLISEAVREAVAPLSFEALHGRKVFVDDRFFGSPDKAFVLGEIRAKLLLAGVQLMFDMRDAEIMLEVRSSGVGIDRYDSLIGIPSIGAAAGSGANAAGVPAGIITPEVAIVKEIKQVSFAGISYVAYWSNTGEVVASSGPSVGRAYRDDWWILGFGPRTLGTVPPVDHQIE
ncbi:MAG TPA: hypothetical protein PLT20_06040 [Sedimentisphaerales bacterium]|nr:hypothetical protein [Phycisphaerae bacterium]HON90087.1 hypothetical protein [Sedimentisphaerales bacterium]HQI27629.1 hypothetical protein [Sedimentisphaerales bacterium]